LAGGIFFALFRPFYCCELNENNDIGEE